MKVKDRDIELAISKVMRWGVIISLTIATLGGLLFLFRHHNEISDFQLFKEKNKTIDEILKDTLSGLFSGSPRAIIMMGILLLFATPFLRVLFSLFGFIIEKDKIYIFITILVLAIIAVSISGGLH